tara:strand:- start:179 stop:370 length:192 start_codon:yes stop_codon:yes gene_type:complete
MKFLGIPQGQSKTKLIIRQKDRCDENHIDLFYFKPLTLQHHFCHLYRIFKGGTACDKQAVMAE